MSNEILRICNAITNTSIRTFRVAHPSPRVNQAKSGSGAPGPKSQDFDKDVLKTLAHFLSADKT